MNTQEHIQLALRLAQTWPGKFSDEDLAFWCKHFDSASLADVIDALIAWKNSKPYPPKVTEISRHIFMESLSKPEVTRPTKRSPRKHYLCEQIVQSNPSLADRSDAELVILFHRDLYWRDMPASEALKPSHAQRVIAQCRRDLSSVGIDEDTVRMYAQIVIVKDAKIFSALIREMNQQAATRN